ncbi:acyltransferase family protein [Zobellia nedashkovskayae]|uniref:acyltransferase family protein n=1 Tax=Zobellia nedashkovskayae TaxID=2779510 RepID=UPI00188A6066|nr:acyltransferase [Zobellia nedashkovskayae]
MKERNISIDILKFFAALLITNSHMELLYPNKIFATGGAIGDALFFFTIGFVLFLKPMGRFDNWYKKRVNRIYPTVFAWAILSTLFFDKDDNIVDVILYGGSWFITCVMIYYVLLYLINRYMINHLYLATMIVIIIVIAWFFLIQRPLNYNIYGYNYFKWGHYFLYALFGAMIGISKKQFKFQFNYDLIKLILSTIVFYGILMLSQKLQWYPDIQLLSLIPLGIIVFYFYKLANNEIVKHAYNSQILGPIMKTISGLCLEIYLVQFSLFTDKMNSIFPLNLLIMFIIIIIAAYILRCLARIFSQTFMEKQFNWKLIFQLY